MAPSTSALLTQWNWEPSVLIGLLLISVAYWYAVEPLRRRRNLGPPPNRLQVSCFALSVLVAFFALISPLDAISDKYLFSAHMVQHLLLASLWPPLVLLSLPEWLVRRFLKRSWRAAIVSFLSFPVLALLLFNVDIDLWHLPVLYDETLSNEQVHILEHLSFMAFGLLNWWPVLSPLPEQRLAYPMRVIYLFVNAMFMMVLGIVFTFSPTPFYAPYVHAPRLWGISALADQQFGGLIMWYPGNLPYAIALVVAFYRWFEGDNPTPSQISGTQSPTIGPPLP